MLGDWITIQFVSQLGGATHDTLAQVVVDDYPFNG
jgi:hypothetical protein